MSVQAKVKHSEATRSLKNAESSSTPKKRKHDPDQRESSKKKKKQRREDDTNDLVNKSQDQAHIREKKKKSRKSTDKVEIVAQPEQEVEETQDVDLPDAPATENTPDENAAARLTESVADDLAGLISEEEDGLQLLDSEAQSSFYSTRLSLYVSIPAISLENGTSSLLATHLAPLLLTYFPPAQGIVLGFSDPVVSAKPNVGMNLPLLPPQDGDIETQADIFAETADEFGVCWTWLKATFLVFRPQRGDELHGWTNVTSEGFVGLVSYNYFQAAVGQTRIPGDWKWNGPTREQAQRNRKKGRKGRLRDEDGGDSIQENGTQETETTLVETSSSQIPLGHDGGYFVDGDGAKIKSTLKFRVLDTEVVPAYEKGKWSLQIDGTLLDEEAERRIVEEERAKFERAQQRSRSTSPGASDVVMSGGLRRSISREGSIASRISGQTPARHRVTY
ncbi:hypothetical protein H2200_000259 [Cladophialophora chaetospira]|uniref:DNA-directed RNA polymerase subunit n=1 Tax=Cladophialophora chaetospira TaxID=386627 RepID=A0AA39CQ59_9EURO|nr:hypothetical protein H2200_000259 [Cladophialophora chaetospira]